MPGPPSRLGQRLWTPAGVASGLTAFVFVAFARAHAVYMTPAVPLHIDEGYEGAFALRMLSGHFLPYVDAVSHRGPVLYWLVAVAQALGGPYSWDGMRWLSLLSGLTTMGACVAIGVLANRPLGGAVAAFVYAFVTTCVMRAENGIGIHGECIAVSFEALGLLAASMALQPASPPPRRDRWLGACGFAMALAALTKQTALPAIAPMFVWLHAAVCTRAQWERPRRSFGALAAGFLGPITATVAVYALCGALRPLWYWYFTYNARVYMEPFPVSTWGSRLAGFSREHAVLLPVLALSILWSLSAPLVASRSLRWRDLLRGYDAVGLETTTAALAVLSLAGALAPMRFWEQYFLPLVPWLGLLAGLRGEGMLRHSARHAADGGPNVPGRPTHTIAAAVVAIPLAGLLSIGTSGIAPAGTDHAANMFLPASSGSICRAVQERSSPDDRIFVWGFSGELYVICERRPASRFVYTTMVEGVVPGAPGIKAERVAPGAVAALLDDLRRSSPAVVVEPWAPSVPISPTNGLRTVPGLADWLDEHMCKVSATAPANLWVRKVDGEGCPPTSSKGSGL
jgi:4-amino-4-deoxy-L-arabinose transferase-like glycosyltransferase